MRRACFQAQFSPKPAVKKPQKDQQQCPTTLTLILLYVEAKTLQEALFFPGPVGDGDGLRDLQANNVTPRTALLSWKPPSNPAGGYRLTYQTEGYETKVRMMHFCSWRCKKADGRIILVTLESNCGHLLGWKAAKSCI